jgi:hypothetical protein
MFGDSLDTLLGRDLWSLLREGREALEQSFVLVIAKAGTTAIPCAEVEQYNALVAAQVDLERRGLSEASQAGLYTGLTQPAEIPIISACQTGEQSIWLNPAQASTALQGAVSRYRGIRSREQAMVRGYEGSVLGSPDAPALPVAGTVLVAWAAQALAGHTYNSPGRRDVSAHLQAVRQYLQARKADVGASGDVLRAVAQARGGTIFGLSPLAALLLAFGAGLAVAGLACYAWGRKRAPQPLQGACARTRRKRVLVME